MDNFQGGVIDDIEEELEDFKNEETKEMKKDMLSYESDNKDACDITSLINLYDQYKAGEATWDQYITYLTDLLSNYVWYLVHKKISIEDPKDLYQSGICAIISHANKYDPNKSRPTSYFTPYICEEMRGQLEHALETSTYYLTTFKRLNDAAIKAGFNGCTDERLSVRNLATIGGLSQKTVDECLSIKKRSIYKQDITESVDVTDGKSAEQIAIENENKEFLFNVFNSLPPFERLVLGTHLFDPDVKKRQGKPFLTKIKSLQPEHPEIEFPTKLTLEYLMKTVNKACNIMRGYPGMKERYPDFYRRRKAGKPNISNRENTEDYENVMDYLSSLS